MLEQSLVRSRCVGLEYSHVMSSVIQGLADSAVGFTDTFALRWSRNLANNQTHAKRTPRRAQARFARLQRQEIAPVCFSHVRVDAPIAGSPGLPHRSARFAATPPPIS